MATRLMRRNDPALKKGCTSYSADCCATQRHRVTPLSVGVLRGPILYISHHIPTTALRELVGLTFCSGGNLTEIQCFFNKLMLR